MTKKRYLTFSFILLVVALCFVLTKTNALAGWVLNSQGWLVYEPDGQVLGQKQPQVVKSSVPAEKEGRIIPPVRIKVQAKEKPATPKNKAILEREGYKVRLKVKDEEGKEVELPEGTESTEFEIEEPEDKRTTKIRSTGKAFMVIRDKIGAQTHFPLMVNLETSELIVTTPAGQKVVTVLPDKAVENMLAANVLDQLGGKGGIRWLEYQEQMATLSGTPTPEDGATPSATPTPEDEEPTPTEELTPTPPGDLTPTAEVETAAVEEVISLITAEDGTLAYEIPGIKFKRLFGLVKIKLDRTAVVSAETGELLAVREALLTRLLDLLSI